MPQIDKKMLTSTICQRSATNALECKYSQKIQTTFKTGITVSDYTLWTSVMS